ncbi:thioredoxin domain-containing protein [Modestobacter sp. I12A-02628]|uniref:Thioredoxin domain-containing protein n=1 Tax=Goekera deserti TaxID=2497753 RepID=A0A7K3WC08_9ACTN|nr:thioredoxin domain-containing protein [Goekera deserti]MPQ98425.1 thioredoxin domain-containing protein [Goekera deserti]NDI48252.1 thioredoxin domain-containing protein [Goekera deserti]NEL54001.1 thioredoxin domain-containing protein [Goekera deserti]
MPTDHRPLSGRAAAQQRIAARRAAESAARQAAERRHRQLVGAVVTAVLLVVAVVVVVAVQSSRTSTAADAATPAGTTGGYAFAVGQADAPVTVQLYEDYQCPNCKAFEDAAGSTLEQLVAAGTVRVEYHGMAFLDTSGNDRYSTRALNAAAVVASTAGTDALERFHDLLYANQPAEGGSGLTDEQLVSYAQQAGATGATVSRQITDLTYGDWVAGATEQASKDGVTGTPTVFVDGERLGDLSAAGVTAAVTAAQAG